MKLERRHAWLLLAVGVWNLVTYAMFARNLYDAHQSGEDRATGYWVAHTVLIVVNVAVGLLLARLGLRAIKALRAPRTPGTSPAPGTPRP